MSQLALSTQQHASIHTRTKRMKPSARQELRLLSERFGEITYAPAAVISFEHGVVGFEDLRSFVVVDIPGCEPFQWLISIDNPTIGFPLLAAGVIDADYEQRAREEAELMSGLTPDHLVVYLIATLPEDLKASTINLRAPVLIDAEHRTGQQIILISDTYSSEYPLFQTTQPS